MREVLARRERIHRLQIIPYRLHALFAHIGRALPEESTGHGILIPAGAVSCAKLMRIRCLWRERIFPVCRLRLGSSGVTRMQRLPCRLLPTLGCTPCLARFRSRSQVVDFGSRNRLYCAFVTELHSLASSDSLRTDLAAAALKNPEKITKGLYNFAFRRLTLWSQVPQATPRRFASPEYGFVPISGRRQNAAKGTYSRFQTATYQEVHA